MRVSSPFSFKLTSRVGHSSLNLSAPVRLPSPPQTTRASMPSLIRLYAAVVRPSIVRKVLLLAVPITVPPYRGSTELVISGDQETHTSPIHPLTSSHPTRTMYRPLR